MNTIDLFLYVIIIYLLKYLININSMFDTFLILLVFYIFEYIFLLEITKCDILNIYFTNIIFINLIDIDF